MSMEQSAALKVRYPFSITEKRKKSYRDLYPDEEEMRRMPPPPKGVMGITPAVTGSIEATEVLKIICGFGEVLSG